MFKDFDTDGSGTLSLEELTTKLSGGALPPGIAQQALRQQDWRDDRMTSAKVDSLAKDFSAELAEAQARTKRPDTGVSEPIHAQRRRKRQEFEANTDRLLTFLGQNVERVMDLFRASDTNGDGLISKSEMREVLTTFNISATSADVKALFKKLDKDGSGTLEYKELTAILKRNVQRRPRLGGSKPGTPATPGMPTTPGIPATPGTPARNAILQKSKSADILSRSPYASKFAGDFEIANHLLLSSASSSRLLADVRMMSGSPAVNGRCMSPSRLPPKQHVRLPSPLWPQTPTTLQLPPLSSSIDMHPSMSPTSGLGLAAFSHLFSPPSPLTEKHRALQDPASPPQPTSPSRFLRPVSTPRPKLVGRNGCPPSTPTEAEWWSEWLLRSPMRSSASTMRVPLAAPVPEGAPDALGLPFRPISKEGRALS